MACLGICQYKHVNFMLKSGVASWYFEVVGCRLCGAFPPEPRASVILLMMERQIDKNIMYEKWYSI